MSSIFDSITVPGAGVTPGSAQVPRYTSYGNSASSSLPTTPPASTGLVATVEVPEFVRLVTEAGPTVVLHSDATQPPPPPGSRPAAVRTLASAPQSAHRRS